MDFRIWSRTNFPVGFVFGRGQDLGAAGDLDGIRVGHADALQELAKPQLKAIVEAPQDGGIAVIFFARSVEVKYLFHGTLLGKCDIHCKAVP